MDTRQLGLWVKNYIRRTSEIVRVRIVGQLDSGEYDCTLVDTTGSIRAVCHPSLEPADGETWVAARIDGSGRANAARFSLIAPAPTQSTNVTEFPGDDSEDYEAISIAIIPDRAYLQRSAPFTPATFTVYGSNLTGVAVSYGHMWITDAASPVITDSSVVLSVRCHPATQPSVGRYSLTIGGIEIPDFFDVY
jgi:hypothetical protein